VYNILQNISNNLALCPPVFTAQVLLLGTKLTGKDINKQYVQKVMVSKLSSSNGTKLKINGKGTKTRKQTYKTMKFKNGKHFFIKKQSHKVRQN